MRERFQDLTGWVLAGGASRRLGRPKQEIVLGGETLLARSVRLAQSVARRVVILGPQEPWRDDGSSGDHRSPHQLEVWPDENPGSGPLSALLGALRRTRTEFNLLLSCDLPLMEARFLRYLASQAVASRAEVTLAVTPEHGYQPLTAVYRRRARPAIAVSLACGRHKMTSFLPRVTVRALEWPEITSAGFRKSIFDNLNTPEDYERARLSFTARSVSTSDR